RFGPGVSVISRAPATPVTGAIVSAPSPHAGWVNSPATFTSLPPPVQRSVTLHDRVANAAPLGSVMVVVTRPGGASSSASSALLDDETSLGPLEHAESSTPAAAVGTVSSRQGRKRPSFIAADSYLRAE